MKLFRRAWKVQIDTLDVSNLSIEFKILSSIKSEPNRCVLTVYNMNQDHRAQILKRNRPSTGAKIQGVPVQIEAGYVEGTAILFSGDLRESASQFGNVDWKTTLSGDDGGRAYREGRIDSQFAAGTMISDILKQCASALGVGSGNVANFTSDARIAGLGTALPAPMTFSGSAAAALTRLVRSMGLTWSVQRGALQILKKGTPLNQSAIFLSPSTGLLDSPEASINATVSLGNAQQFAPGAKAKVATPPKPKDPGIIKIKTAMIPGMAPGRKISLQSREFNGGYYLTECEYIGQSWSTESWHINSVARIY